jgi:3-hydroxyisobutyrate dehydrogenase-like beta-hydroxyacid dehydrogenase
MSNNKLIGFVGVGVMGRPMATRLLERGYTLLVNDRSPEAVAHLVGLGARAAASAREVADEARIVFTSLPTPAIFKQVALDDGGLSDGKAVKVVVDLSTVGPTMTKAVATALRAKGVEVVDAPVSGGAEGATKGTLSVMAAGHATAVEEVRELLDIFGKVFVVGNEAGQGQLMKLLNNMLSSTAFAITSEAYVAGIRGGLDPALMMSVINAGSGRNGATQDKFPKQVLSGTFDFGFPMSSVCKDIGLAIQECEALGVSMWVGNTVRQVWNFAASQDGGTRDMTELPKSVEDWAKPVSATNKPK